MWFFIRLQIDWIRRCIKLKKKKHTNAGPKESSFSPYEIFPSFPRKYETLYSSSPRQSQQSRLMRPVARNVIFSNLEPLQSHKRAHAPRCRLFEAPFRNSGLARRRLRKPRTHFQIARYVKFRYHSFFLHGRCYRSKDVEKQKNKKSSRVTQRSGGVDNEKIVDYSRAAGRKITRRGYFYERESDETWLFLARGNRFFKCACTSGQISPTGWLLFFFFCLMPSRGIINEE